MLLLHGVIRQGVADDQCARSRRRVEGNKQPVDVADVDQVARQTRRECEKGNLHAREKQKGKSESTQGTPPVVTGRQ